MSATSRRRKLNDLRRKAEDSAGHPATHCVVSLDTYMGDGPDSPDFGYAGINDIFGPFTKEQAEAFVAEKEASDNYMFVEYEVRALKSA